MEPKISTIEMNLAGRNLKIETGWLAEQASGSALISLGDTVILATAMIGNPKEGQDFFPMSVDYEEKFFASGKIKGSRFIKREGRPSDNAILTSRLIDRPLRPLFPKGTTNEVQIICTVLSADLEVDPGTTAIIGASAALMLSGVTFAGPIGAVRIGLVVDTDGNEQLVVNPTYEQCAKGKLNLVVAGTKDAITMVEAGAIEVSEEKMLEALELAHRQIKKLCEIQEELKSKLNPKPIELSSHELPEFLSEAVAKHLTPESFKNIKGESKKEVKEKISELEETLLSKFVKEIEEEKCTESDVKNALKKIFEKQLRSNILTEEKRLDGRKLDEIRPILCKVGLLPRTHGSALFQRGETQALSVATLGSPGSAQVIDTMDEDSEKRYMHHYNFPPFSTGEVKMMRGPSRREIGHGFLAERSLVPSLPAKEDFPYTIMVVSEIVSCNGSSSMASVCGSTLSLMDAGVPIKKPVAGIAMGLITDGQGGYKILTDIQGMEDFAGDMDFKVTGTKDGINALQMDIKVTGISTDIMREALSKAKTARLFVLQKMLECLAEPRKQLSKYAPLITSIRILPDQIREVIGKGGETIQKITKETGVEIDIEDDGLVMITAQNQESGTKALEWIKKITYIPKAGDVFEGKVTRIMEFGAFVEFAPGKEGLVHISQLDVKRVNRVEDSVKLGDKIKVKLMEIDDQGRYNLSKKALLSMNEPKKN